MSPVLPGVARTAKTFQVFVRAYAKERGSSRSLHEIGAQQ